MATIFLTTIISCNQLLGIINRLEKVKILTWEQKISILQELNGVSTTCPLIIKKDENK